MLRASAPLLLHPLTLLALVVWAANDHWLKQLWPGVVTGKLSDVTSLIVAPVLIFAWLELSFAALILPRKRTVLAGASAACGVGMLLINVIAGAADLYRVGLGLLQWPYWRLVLGVQAGGPLEAGVRLTMDWSDGLCMPCALIPVAMAARAWHTSEG